jgi:CRISPR system Cascade subunit CasC
MTTSTPAAPSTRLLDTTDTTGLPGRFVVIHTLTTMAAVNPNSNFAGVPKRFIYGGAERLQISSQARCRAARQWSREFLTEGDHAARSRLLPARIAKILSEEYGRDPAEAGYAAAALVIGAGMGIKWDRPDKTTAEMFIPADADSRLARLAHERWNELSSAREVARTEIAKAHNPTSKTKRRTPEEADGQDEDAGAPVASIPAELKKAAQAAFNPSASIEIALYGRMLANIPGANVPSAVQVADALSVDAIQDHVDDFTVVDDWRDDADFGSANLGQRYLASGTLYGFAALDRGVLRTTLSAGHADADQASRLAERVFVSAMAWSTPSGHRNRTGSSAAPTLVIVATLDQNPRTLAPAFEHPVPPPAAVEAATRLCQLLTEIQRIEPLHGGKAIWLHPDRLAAPPLPDPLTLI